MPGTTPWLIPHPLSWDKVKAQPEEQRRGLGPFSLLLMDGWVGTEGGLMRRAEQRCPQKMSCAPEAGIAHAISWAGDCLVVPQRQEVHPLVQVLGKTCPQQPGDGLVPVIPCTFT